MGTVALLNMFFQFNAVGLSDHTRNCVLALDAAQLNSEAFGDSWEEVTGGLKAGTINVDLLDDFALSSIDATLWAAFISATGLVAFEVRPDAGARSTTNPGYTGNIHVSQYSLGGQLNTMAMKSQTYKISGAVTRNTA